MSPRPSWTIPGLAGVFDETTPLSDSHCQKVWIAAGDDDGFASWGRKQFIENLVLEVRIDVEMMGLWVLGWERKGEDLGGMTEKMSAVILS